MSSLKQFELAFLKALKKYGYDLPETEHELKEAKKALNNKDIPKIPKHLDSPAKILNRNIITKIPFNSRSIPLETTRNLAMAAREGKNISEDILKEMAKDRKEAEGKK